MSQVRELQKEKDDDRYSPPQDCNDNDPGVHPGAAEACDREDNGCDDVTDEGFDKDGEGYTTCSGDYNDNDPGVHPGATKYSSTTFYGSLAALIVILTVISFNTLKKIYKK